MTKKWRIFRFLCLIALVGAITVLVYEASLDGAASSEHSNAVGGVIAGGLNDINGDQSEVIDPTSVTIDNKTELVSVGDKLTLITTLLPEEATYKSLVYESSDTSVATISTTGVVSFKKAGTVTITVKSSEEKYNNVKDSFTVQVNSVVTVDITCSINAEKDGDVYKLHEESSYKVSTKFNPTNATDKSLTYSVSNSEFVTISKKGAIEAIKESGDEIIEITITHAEVGSKVLKVKVIESLPVETDPEDPKPSEPVYTKSIKLSKNGNVIDISSGAIDVLITDSLSIILDAKITASKLVVSTSNEDIASINNKGVIILHEVGQDCVITVKETYSGLAISFKLNVLNYYLFAENFVETNMSYNDKNNTYVLRNGTSGKITPILMENSTFTDITFFSSDESIIVVGKDGVLTPKKTGKATITMVCDDGISGKQEASIKVEVEAKPFIENITEFYYTVRKSIGHYAAFLVLGICSTFVALLYFKPKYWAISLPLNLGLGFGVGALTEYIQTFVPGRYGCMDDVWIDFSGFVTSAVIISLIFIIVVVIKIAINKRKNKVVNV